MSREKPKAQTVIGIDGCRAGWLAVVLRDDGGYGSRCEPTLDFLAAYPSASVLIDMPIGLPDAGQPARECDRAARRYLGRGASSRVFSPPVREVFQLTDYREACQHSRELTGKAFSKQAFNILPKIRQLDAYLCAQPALAKRVRESHPEVCFAALNGGKALPGKKRRGGLAARLRLLADCWPQSAAIYNSLRATYLKKAVADDDIADAMVLAWVAQSRTLATLPAGPPCDTSGLPMQIVYPA